MHALSSSVVSPIVDMHEQSTNDDIFVGKDPLPEPLSSDFVCAATDLRGWMSRSVDFPPQSSIDDMGLGGISRHHRQGDASLPGITRGPDDQLSVAEQPRSLEIALRGISVTWAIRPGATRGPRGA
jgi:hypothetical protein